MHCRAPARDQQVPRICVIDASRLFFRRLSWQGMDCERSLSRPWTADPAHWLWRIALPVTAWRWSGGSPWRYSAATDEPIPAIASNAEYSTMYAASPIRLRRLAQRPLGNIHQTATPSRGKGQAGNVDRQPAAANLDDVFEECVVVLVVHAVHDQPVGTVGEREHDQRHGGGDNYGSPQSGRLGHRGS